MRVTNQMMTSSVLTNLNALRNRTATLSQQISSGQRISFVSDDPMAGSEVMRTQTRLQVMKQWQSNLEDARGRVGSTEAALDRMIEVTHRVKEINIMATNGALDASTRQQLAPEVDELLNDLVGILNTQSDGYLFGGFQSGTAPFSIDTTTGAVTYNGDSGEILREVGPGVTVTANLHGNRLWDWTLPENILTTVWQLSENIKNGPVAGVPANIPNVDKAMDNLIGLRTEVGARDQRLEQVDARLKDMDVQFNGTLEKAQGVEVEKAIMELTNAETTYRAALQVGARVIPPTLVDFLR